MSTSGARCALPTANRSGITTRWQHLDECFELLDTLDLVNDQRARIALALWFHDAIYDPRRRDNEARSAEWACRALDAAGAAPALQQRVTELVMSTAHRAEPADEDARLLVDIDLSILAAEPPRYAEYERQIRAEYAHVPDADFQRGRAAILRQFQLREPLYTTAALHGRLEVRAHHNLDRALAALSSNTG